MLLIEAFTLLKEERTVCTTLRWGAFQLLARANKVVLCLFHLRVDLAALVQRQGEAQTYFVLTHIAVVILGRIGFRAAVGRIRDTGRRAQAQVGRWPSCA